MGAARPIQFFVPSFPGFYCQTFLVFDLASFLPWKRKSPKGTLSKGTKDGFCEGWGLRNKLLLRRRLPRLIYAVAVSALLTAGLTLVGTKPVLAEFEIQEAGIEKGELELEYRGAYHWGLPKAGGAGGNILETEEGEGEEEVPLRQSHDFEFEMGITERWMISTTLITTVPAGFNWQTDAVELETQYEFIERHGNGIGFAFAAGYGWATQAETPNEVEFGPIVELAAGKFLLTTNTFFTRQLAEFAETEGLGFEYGWRAEYDFAKHWGVGVEMFGEIEDLANAGSFDDQEHSIGPTLFFKPGGDEDDEAVGNVGEDDDDGGNAPEHAKAEFSMNVGVQFALTDVTSATALKFQGSLAF
jgi:hypothetical protein